MDFLHYEEHLSAGDGFRVVLDAQANVCLMDETNFYYYRSGNSFKYHGGLMEKSPVVLRAPHSGRWHLTIDLGGYSGSIRAGVTVLKAA